MGYDAFISYSHAADGRLAPALQDGMHRLGKPWYRRRALHIFRDETGLSTNPHLWSSIEAALDSSKWFVLLASPESASSEWVNREIAHWLATKSADTILPIVTDGGWNWSGTTSTLHGDAVPEPLRVALRAEPRHLDLRWARQETQTDLRNARFRDAVAQIAAPMHGLSKDDLESEDVRQHRRTIRTARAVAFALAILTAVALIAALAAARNARQARKARNESDRARNESDFQRIIAQSGNLRKSNRQVALLLAVEARHLRDTPQSRGALQAALTQDPRYLGTIAGPTSQSGAVRLCPLGNNRDLLIAGEDGTIEFVNIETGQEIGQPTRLVAADKEVVRSVDLSRSSLGCAVSANAATVAVYSADGSIFTLDPRTHAIRSRRASHSELNDIAISPNGRTIAVGTGDGKVLVWPVDNANAPPRTLDSGDTAVSVAFSPDGTTLATSTPDRILSWDATNWAQRRTIDDSPSNYESGGLVQLAEPWRRIRFSPDGRSLVDGRRGETRMFDVATGAMRWAFTINDIGGHQVAFGSKTGALYTISPDDWIVQYDVMSGAPRGQRLLPISTGLAGFAVSDDGSTLLADDSTEHLSVEKWALDGRNAIGHVVASPGQAPVSYSPDGKTLLTRSASTSQFVAMTDAWDAATGRHLGHIPTAAFPQLLDAHTVVGYFLDRLSVDRLDLRTGKYVGPRFPVQVAGAAIEGNDLAGNLVIAYSDGSMDRYLPNGTQVGKPWLRLKLVPYDITVSARGLVAMSTDDGRTVVYHLATATPAYPPIENFADAAFSSDGTLLLGTTSNGQVVIRDASTGSPVGSPIEARSAITYAQLGGDGTLALLGETSARLYDLRTEEPIGDAIPSTQPPVLRNDGRELATSTAYGVLLWDLNPNHWERAACKLAGRNLTHDEWATYFPNAGSYHATCTEWPSTP